MANKFRNEVEIELKGKVYKLRASWETMVNIETELDTSILAILAQRSIPLKMAATIILLGLHGADDKSLTFEQVGKAVFEEGMFKVAKPVLDFLSIALDGASLGKPETETGAS